MRKIGRAGLVLVSGWVVLAGCSKRIVSDSEIASCLKASLYSDSELRPLGLVVAVKDGEVMLSGAVPNAELQLRAFKIAYKTAGVNAIQDEMKVIPAPNPPVLSATPRPEKPPLAIKAAFPGKPLPLPPEPELSRVTAIDALPDPPTARLPTSPERAPVRSPHPQTVHPQTNARRIEATLPASLSEFTTVTTGLPSRNIRREYQHLTLVTSGPPEQNSSFKDLLADFQSAQRKITIEYNTASTGLGLKHLAEGVTDLLISPGSLSSKEMSRFTQQPRQVPFAIYGLVPVYHLPGIVETVNFTPAALAGIFLGQVSKWNDPLLKAANPKLALPDRNIVVAHQLDNAGSSLWGMYLSKVSEEFRSRRGAISPAGTAVRGDRGTLDFVRQVPYSTGYSELATRTTSPVWRGAVRNVSGNFVSATVESLAAAALSPSELAPDGRISILNASGRDAYPIAGFEWLVFRDTQGPQRDGLETLVEWVLTKRKGKFPLPGYAALPEPFAAALWDKLQSR